MIILLRYSGREQPLPGLLMKLARTSLAPRGLVWGIIPKLFVPLSVLSSPQATAVMTKPRDSLHM